MAARFPFLSKLQQASGPNTPLINSRHISQRLQQQQTHRPAAGTSTRPFTRAAPRQNYNHFGSANPYLPAPPTPKPARSTTFFRAVNTASGLAAVYLLFCAVDELQLASDALAHMQSNHSLDVLERLLERARAQQDEAAPRDREFERRLTRWRSLAREEMMSREDSLRAGE